MGVKDGEGVEGPPPKGHKSENVCEDNCQPSWWPESRTISEWLWPSSSWTSEEFSMSGWGWGSHQPFFLFLFLIFFLYNIVLVLPYINMYPPQVYTCSPSWTALPPPSPYHPSGSSQCTSHHFLSPFCQARCYWVFIFLIYFLINYELLTLGKLVCD